MSEKVTVLIDGYNVIRGVPELDGEIESVSLEHARNRLIALSNAYRTRLNGTVKTIVVFDGDSTIGPSRFLKTGQTHVIFTETDEEADTRIIEMLRAGEGHDKFIIVSDDTDISIPAREHRAEVESPVVFYQKASAAQRPKRKKRKGPVITDKPVGGTEAKITRELMDLWCDNDNAGKG